MIARPSASGSIGEAFVRHPQAGAATIPGSPTRFDRHRRRWIVERTFAWLGNFRRLLVRREHSVHTYLAFLTIACLIVALRAISG